MALTKVVATVTNAGGLADQPTQSAAELKTLFDKAGVDLKDYINTILTAELDSALGVLTSAVAARALFKKTTGTFTSGGTTHQVTDAFITANTQVIVTPTEAMVGIWTWVPTAGSFTITSTETETSDVDFTWSATK